jgi:hypothetical protein
VNERVLLVGESNPYGSDAYFALYPEPAGAAGARLCAILGLSHREYLRTFDRTNLLRTASWNLAAARRGAAALTHRRRILLGARVAAAHGVAFLPFSQFWLDELEGTKSDTLVLVLPHPSGRCRLWNAPKAAGRARAVVREFLARCNAERKGETRDAN